MLILSHDMRCTDSFHELNAITYSLLPNLSFKKKNFNFLALRRLKAVFPFVSVHAKIEQRSKICT